MKLISVNTGTAQAITISPTRVDQTGIFKEPVGSQVVVGTLGLDNDAIVDTENHGGPDQAVYVYGSEDYDWWADQLGQTLAPGTFGENLTLEGLPSADCAVGDRLTVGDVVLEITAPRIPCGTFAAKMAEPGWVARFRQARRPGAYCRVIQTGAVSAGDPVSHDAYDGARVDLLAIYDDWYDRTTDPATLDRYLAAPVGIRLRHALLARREDA